MSLKSNRTKVIANILLIHFEDCLRFLQDGFNWVFAVVLLMLDKRMYYN